MIGIEEKRVRDFCSSKGYIFYGYSFYNNGYRFVCEKENFKATIKRYKPDHIAKENKKQVTNDMLEALKLKFGK